VSKGEAGDAPYFHPLLKQVKIPQAKGRPRTRPQEIVADKAYDSAQLRKRLRQRGIRAMIPERNLPEGRKRRKRGPHYRFDKDIYKKRAAIDQIRSIGTVHRLGQGMQKNRYTLRETGRQFPCYDQAGYHQILPEKLFIRHSLV
jgi:hypothetical protein